MPGAQIMEIATEMHSKSDKFEMHTNTDLDYMAQSFQVPFLAESRPSH